MHGQQRWWQRIFGRCRNALASRAGKQTEGERPMPQTNAHQRLSPADRTAPTLAVAGDSLAWSWWLSLMLALVVCRLLPYAVPKLVSYLLPGVDGRQVAFYLFNITPLGAACIFTGAVLARPGQAFLLPLVALAVSDLILTVTGWAPIPGVRVVIAWPFVVDVQWVNVMALARHVLIQYCLFLTMTVLGRWWLRRQRKMRRVLGTCLASGLLFWLVADGQVWWFSPNAPLPPDMLDSYWGRLLYAFSPQAFLQLRGYPKTLDGLITCYLMGLPFSLRFLASTVVFGWVFFLSYAWAERFAVGWQTWGQSQPASATR